MKHLRLTIVLCVSIMLVVLLASRSALAAPTFGTITINSTADTNTSDSVLTLREALLIARGGTGTVSETIDLTDMH
jgi:hypothetical protein